MEKATFLGYIVALIDAATRIPASTVEYVRRFSDNHSPRFNCTCSYKYTGKRCGQTTHPRNWKDIANNGAAESRKYDIFDSANKRFSVYCDLQSEPGFVWALIQSLSIANKAMYKDKGFGRDLPLSYNNNEPDWSSYRLSLSYHI